MSVSAVFCVQKLFDQDSSVYIYLKESELTENSSNRLICITILCAFSERFRPFIDSLEVALEAKSSSLPVCFSWCFCTEFIHFGCFILELGFLVDSGFVFVFFTCWLSCWIVMGKIKNHQLTNSFRLLSNISLRPQEKPSFIKLF